jgi:MFS family permease
MATFSLGVSFVWVSYSAILLPVQVQAFAPPDRQAVFVGAIAGPSILCGILANILAGVLSDRSQSRWGRRRPLILAGGLLALASILPAALLPSSFGATLTSFLGIQIATNLAAGAYQPILADLVPENQRGMAGGFIGLFTLLGAALGFGLVTFLVNAGLMAFALLLLAAAFLAGASNTAWTIRHDDQPLTRRTTSTMDRALRDLVRLPSSAQGFLWFTLGMLLINTSVASFQYFGLYYLQTVLDVSDPLAALQATGLVNLLVSMAAAIAVGILSDRLHRRNLIAAASALAGLTVLSFPYAPTLAVFLIQAGVYALMTGAILGTGRAFAAGLVPPEESGKYMSVFNLASAVAQMVAAPLFGTLLNLGGAPTVGSFVLVFAVVAAFYLLSTALLMNRVPATTAGGTLSAGE